MYIPINCIFDAIIKFSVTSLDELLGISWQDKVS